MNSKYPVNRFSRRKPYIHVINDAFSHFVINSNNAKTAVKTLPHKWNFNHGQPMYLVTERGSENVNVDMAQRCTLLRTRHYRKTP